VNLSKVLAERLGDAMSTIQDAVKQLLQIVEQLRRTYPKKRFTLDGRLIGDLGETLAEGEYEIEIYDSQRPHYDARMYDGRQIQIKATMQNSLTFPADHVPDYYLGIRIHPDGTFTEVFNGPGAIAVKAIENRKAPKTNLHSVSINALEILNKRVRESDRIPRRANE
jgi:hypothetical protein